MTTYPSWLLPIIHRLKQFERQPIQKPQLRPAAVCFVLISEQEQPHFVLTQRASHLKRHAGQFALPGGRLDTNETAEAAALRELAEEIGLELQPQAILGELDDFETRSGFCITPFVVWGGENPSLSGDPREVSVVHRVPVAQLKQEPLLDLYTSSTSDSPILSLHLRSSRAEPLHVFAPTAALIYQWREVALFGRSTRVAHYEQPSFAWR